MIWKPAIKSKQKKGRELKKSRQAYPTALTETGSEMEEDLQSKHGIALLNFLFCRKLLLVDETDQNNNKKKKNKKPMAIILTCLSSDRRQVKQVL